MDEATGTAGGTVRVRVDFRVAEHRAMRREAQRLGLRTGEYLRSLVRLGRERRDDLVGRPGLRFLDGEPAA